MVAVTSWLWGLGQGYSPFRNQQDRSPAQYYLRDYNETRLTTRSPYRPTGYDGTRAYQVEQLAARAAAQQHAGAAPSTHGHVNEASEEHDQFPVNPISFPRQPRPSRRHLRTS